MKIVAARNFPKKVELKWGFVFQPQHRLKARFATSATQPQAHPLSDISLPWPKMQTTPHQPD